MNNCSYKENEIISVLGTTNKIVVVFCPKLMKEINVGIACATHFKIDDGTISPGIGIDNEFLILPQFHQEFFMLHEVAHINNGDVDINSDMTQILLSSRLSGNIPEMEFIADKFAYNTLVNKYGIEYVHDIFNDMNKRLKNKLTNTTPNTDVFTGVNELIIRINKLLIE